MDCWVAKKYDCRVWGVGVFATNLIQLSRSWIICLVFLLGFGFWVLGFLIESRLYDSDFLYFTVGYK